MRHALVAQMKENVARAWGDLENLLFAFRS